MVLHDKNAKIVIQDKSSLAKQMIDLERETLEKLWDKEEISYTL